ncbi:MAG: AI-2E family transporter, partial [Thermomonas sp.]
MSTPLIDANASPQPPEPATPEPVAPAPRPRAPVSLVVLASLAVGYTLWA